MKIKSKPFLIALLVGVGSAYFIASIVAPRVYDALINQILQTPPMASLIYTLMYGVVSIIAGLVYAIFARREKSDEEEFSFMDGAVGAAAVCALISFMIGIYGLIFAAMTGAFNMDAQGIDATTGRHIMFVNVGFQLLFLCGGVLGDALIGVISGGLYAAILNR